ncbi:hypothetical protein SAMN05444161_5858 [Rhizobiales bacterium GAS191]|nr:hypothetical protein SAMN05444161_5858 [Rhizobiales bacterium GAS191]
MKVVVPSLCFVLTLPLSFTPLAAQGIDPNLSLKGFKGTCTVSRIGNEPVRCASDILYSHFPSTRRTAFAINVAHMDGRETLLWMSGGKDSQPTLNEYRLQVDALRTTVSLNGKKISEDNLAARGQCVVLLNDKGTFVNNFSCKVSAPRYGAVEVTMINAIVH